MSNTGHLSLLGCLPAEMLSALTSPQILGRWILGLLCHQGILYLVLGHFFSGYLTVARHSVLQAHCFCCTLVNNFHSAVKELLNTYVGNGCVLGASDRSSLCSVTKVPLPTSEEDRNLYTPKPQCKGTPSQKPASRDPP